MPLFNVNHRLLRSVAFTSVVSIALWANAAPTSPRNALADVGNVATPEDRTTVYAQEQTSLESDSADVAADNGNSDTTVCTKSQASDLSSATAASQSVSISSSSAVSSGTQVLATSVPTMSTAPPFASAQAVPPGQGATFHICAPSDPQAERAIEELIGGRGFRASLVNRSDGCADLSISVSPLSSTGRASTSLTVSTGANAGRPQQTISIQIVSENGVTRAGIGTGR